MNPEYDFMNGDLDALGTLNGPVTKVYVHVEAFDGTYLWMPIQASSISDGMKKAMKMPGVFRVLEGSIVPGGVVT